MTFRPLGKTFRSLSMPNNSVWDVCGKFMLWPSESRIGDLSHHKPTFYHWAKGLDGSSRAQHCLFSYTLPPFLSRIEARRDLIVWRHKLSTMFLKLAAQPHKSLPSWSSTWQAQHRTTSGHLSIAPIIVAHVVNLGCDTASLEPASCRTTSQRFTIGLKV